jgi:O-antigen ligase
MAGILVGISHYAAIALAIGIGIISVVAREPIRALACLIIISPFAGTTYLKDPLLGLPGFKPLQILALLIIIVSLLNYAKSEKTPKWVLYFIIGIVGIFTASLLRSLQYLDLYNQHYFLKLRMSTEGYLLSEYIKPIIYFLPFVVIVKFANSREKLEFIYKTIYATLVILSVHLLITYMSGITGARLELEDVTDFYSTYFSLHRNDLANFYIIGLPVAIGRLFYDRKIYDIVFNVIIISAIGILFSRTAYITTVLSIMLFLVLTKRINIMPVVLIGILIASLSVFGSMVMERAGRGTDTTNKDVNVILAGRVDSIWVPLINEYVKAPKKLILGKGRYSIIASDAKKSGAILKGIAHPHNMYLEMIMDAGVVGLVFFIALYYKIVASALRKSRLLKDDGLKNFLYSNIISIICFLAAGFSGRSFFPKHDNILIWVILGCTVSLYNVWNKAENKNNAS